MTEKRLNVATLDAFTVDTMESIAESLNIPAHEALLAFDGVALHLGLDSNDIALMHALVTASKPQDWDLGRRPVIWPSGAELQHATKLSPQVLAHHISNLVRVGLILFKQDADGQGDADGNIVEARGFDLSPLVARTAEFEWLAEALDYERQVRNHDCDESADLVGSILATLYNTAYLAQNSALNAMKIRFQILLAALPFQGGDALLFSKSVSSFLSRWTGALSYEVDGKSDEPDTVIHGAPADCEQPDPGAEYSQAVYEIISDCSGISGEAESFYGKHNNADLEQPDVGSHQNMCSYEKSWYAASGDRNLIDVTQQSVAPTLAAFAEMPIEMFRKTQIPVRHEPGVNRRISLLRMH